MPVAALDIDIVRLAIERINSVEDERVKEEVKARKEAMKMGTPDAELPPVEAALPVESGLQLGDSQPPQVPAVVIAPVTVDYDEGAAAQVGAYQRATSVLGAFHVVAAANTRRRAGGAALEPLAALVGRTRDALQAWVPVQEDLPAGVRRQGIDPLRLRRGRLIEIAQGRAIWLDEYTFAWRPSSRETRR